jgi:hypothetical protein
VRARHILKRIHLTEECDSTTIRLLDSLRQRILAGDNFAELAKKFSEDKETNLIGGTLGTLELDQLDKSWYATVSPLQAGEISAPARLPVGSSYGYHIVQMRNRIPAHTMTLEQDYHKLEQIALNYKRTRDYQAWLDELRSRIWKIAPTARTDSVSHDPHPAAPYDVEANSKGPTTCAWLPVIIGQDAVVEHMLVALLSRGHCLLVGVPGLAKTLLIRTLAQVLDLKFNRIQFTPDLMPSDITGTEIIEDKPGTGSKAFRFVHGPVFANIVLADEINRTPKTQAALPAAEHRVTAAGTATLASVSRQRKIY